jgi:hypothetical protein
MLKHFIIPSEKNNHTPHLLHRSAFIIYIVIIFAFNTVLTQLGYTDLKADVTIEELIEEHNKERRINGLEDLKYNSLLSESAKAKAESMLLTNCWSHYCPEGKSPWDFFDESGYKYQYAGENLAEGFSTVSNVINAWMNSPTHRENILNSNFTEVGFGFAYGDFQGKENNMIITVHFGKAMETIVSDVSVSDSESATTQSYVTINNLTNDQVISTNNFDITGTVNPGDSEILVNINEETVGRVVANGPSYTYRTNGLKDGEYLVQSRIYNDLSKIESSKIKIYYDAATPFLYTDSVLVDKIDEDKFFLNFQTSNDVSNVELNIANFQAVKQENSNWSIRIDVNDLTNIENLNFKLLDKSNNSAEFHVSKSDILSTLNHADEFKIEPVIKNIAPSFIENFKSNSFKSVLSIGFIIYIIVLLTIDFVFLIKTNSFSETGRKSHLQFSLFVILLIALNIGGISGQILKGITV